MSSVILHVRVLQLFQSIMRLVKYVVNGLSILCCKPQLSSSISSLVNLTSVRFFIVEQNCCCYRLLCEILVCFHCMACR